MIPILFSWGPVKIYSFGVMILCGLFLSLFLMRRVSRRDGFPGDDTSFDLVFVTVMAGFLGARVLYILQNWQWYLENPGAVFFIWEGGLTFYGGMIGSLAALFLFMKKRGIPPLKGLDFLIPYVALTQAFGRIGCFLNGCCLGKECALPWAVVYPGSDHAVHPAQLYEAVYVMGLYGFLAMLYAKKKFNGQVICAYMMAYAAGRFIVEFFRDGNSGFLILTWNQWGSIAIVFLAAAAYRFLSGNKPAQTFFAKNRL